jgi:REP element-mobilizing transposase RayT
MKVARQLPLDLARRTWGGKRKGAGRKPKGARAGMPHRPRRPIAQRHPVHVTLRVVPAVGRLRRLDCYRAVRRAMITSLASGTFRICQLSIQSNHIHLIAEADDRASLALGMRGFQISAARRLNAAISLRCGTRRRGQVFADRYHDEQLTNPTQVRNALNYVLNNWRRHEEDRGAPHLAFDPYSSARSFPWFRERPEPGRWGPTDEPLPVAFPTTWLLETGWRRNGRLSLRAVPGPRRS